MIQLPVKVNSIPEEFSPSYLNGSAHTAHPNVCPRTDNLVGWHWSQLPDAKSLEVTFTEWDPNGFKKVASTTYEIPGCELAPHDMAITENYIVFQVNCLTMNSFDFMSGLKGSFFLFLIFILTCQPVILELVFIYKFHHKILPSHSHSHSKIANRSLLKFGNGRKIRSRYLGIPSSHITTVWETQTISNEGSS